MIGTEYNLQPRVAPNADEHVNVARCRGIHMQLQRKRPSEFQLMIGDGRRGVRLCSKGHTTFESRIQAQGPCNQECLPLRVIEHAAHARVPTPPLLRRGRRVGVVGRALLPRRRVCSQEVLHGRPTFDVAGDVHQCCSLAALAAPAADGSPLGAVARRLPALVERPEAQAALPRALVAELRHGHEGPGRQHVDIVRAVQLHAIPGDNAWVSPPLLDLGEPRVGDVPMRLPLCDWEHGPAARQQHHGARPGVAEGLAEGVQDVDDRLVAQTYSVEVRLRRVRSQAVLDGPEHGVGEVALAHAAHVVEHEAAVDVVQAHRVGGGEEMLLLEGIADVPELAHVV
mmetsp:Transcript_63719/g.206935  ORF Transcript_63719/g.206935 Transcript_63719/m.206935 type:complete len:341 (+) Transcript_63719:1249-2271(+)